MSSRRSGGLFKEARKRDRKMINTNRWFIHIDNGSVVPWTSEIEDNYKFKEITAKVAMAIERGKISAKEVIEQITKQIKTATLEQMLEAKLKMNVREGELNLEKQVQEDNSQKDTGDADPYKVNIPGEGAKSNKGGGKKDKPADAGEPADGGEEPKPSGDASPEAVAEALAGGVNV